MSITLDAVRQAHARIAPHIQRTPFEQSHTLSEQLGCELFIKFENLQFTASFKERGALNALLASNAATEHGMEGVFEALFTDLPPIENVERRTEVILGVDENPINLYIHTPKNASAEVPCVYHIHGGGMVLLEAAGAAQLKSS